MKLLYIWIEKYKNIEGEGFNLSSDYHFEYKDGQISGGKKPELEQLPKHFWGIKNIVDIKALIGVNGAGKSSLINRIIEYWIAIVENKSFGGFLIFEARIETGENEMIYLFDGRNYKMKIFKDKIGDLQTLFSFETKVELQNNFKHDPKFATVFYSNHIDKDSIYNFTGTQKGTEDVYETYWAIHYDLSLTNQIINDQKSFSNSPSEQNVWVRDLLAFSNKETIRFLDVIFHKPSFKSVEEIIKKGISSKKSILTIRFNHFHEKEMDELIQNADKTKDELPTPKSLLYALINDPLAGNDKFRIEFWYHIFLVFIKSRFFTTVNFKVGDESFLNAITSKLNILTIRISENSTKHPILVIHELIQELNGEENGNELKRIIDFDSINKKTEDLLKFLKENNVFFSNNNLEFNLQNTNMFYEQFLQQKDTFSNLLFSIFQFDFPGFSDGERNRISMLGRFLNELLLPQKSNEKLIILDEPEVTYHPEWQRRFLNDFLNDITSIWPETKIQIILTSHSPIIISDLPKQSVLLLKNGKSEENHKNTFGANIHDLYRNEFFLTSTMGEFARNKIVSLANYLDPKQASKDEGWTFEKARQYINLIGDEVIKARLRELLNIKPLDKKTELLLKKDQIEEELKMLDNENNQNNG